MRLPDSCPSCGANIRVTRLACENCDTRVEGSFSPCPICALSGEDRKLLDLFIRVRGNVKDIERELGLSYPTVRGRLEQLWVRMGYGPEKNEEGPSAGEIVRNLRDGKCDLGDAADRLRRGGAPGSPKGGSGGS